MHTHRFARCCSLAARGITACGIAVLVVAGFSRVPAHASPGSYSHNGVSMNTVVGHPLLSDGGTPTGVWTGPPEQVGEAQAVSYPNGRTVYYAYFRGLGLSSPGDAYTQILATDEWRTTNATYDRSTDTVEFVARDGSHFRRQFTPVYGVVVITTPSVSEQAAVASSSTTIPGALFLADGSMQSVVLATQSWRANHGPAAYPASGSSIDITADPDIATGGTATPKFWGAGPIGVFPPILLDNSVVAATTFSITVPGFADDLRSGTVFVPPNGANSTPDVNIAVMQGYTESHLTNVGWVAPGIRLVNSNATTLVSAGVGLPTVPPPPPGEEQLMRFCILYVPGDTGELSEFTSNPGGQ